MKKMRHPNLETTIEVSDASVRVHEKAGWVEVTEEEESGSAWPRSTSGAAGAGSDDEGSN